MGDDGSGVDHLLNVREGAGSRAFLLGNVSAEYVVLGTLAFGSGGDEGDSLLLYNLLLFNDQAVLFGYLFLCSN